MMIRGLLDGRMLHSLSNNNSSSSKLTTTMTGVTSPLLYSSRHLSSHSSNSNSSSRSHSKPSRRMICCQIWIHCTLSHKCRRRYLRPCLLPRANSSQCKITCIQLWTTWMTHSMMLWVNRHSRHSPNQTNKWTLQPLKWILRWRKWSRWEDKCSRCSRWTTDSPRLQLSNSSSKWWCNRWARWCQWCSLWWPMHLISNNSLSNKYHQCSRLNLCNLIQTNSNSSNLKLSLPLRMILLQTYLIQWPRLSLHLSSKIPTLPQAIPLIWTWTVETVAPTKHNLTILLTSEKKLWN